MRLDRIRENEHADPAIGTARSRCEPPRVQRKAAAQYIGSRDYSASRIPRAADGVLAPSTAVADCGRNAPRKKSEQTVSRLALLSRQGLQFRLIFRRVYQASAGTPAV